MYYHDNDYDLTFSRQLVNMSGLSCTTVDHIRSLRDDKNFISYVSHKHITNNLIIRITRILFIIMKAKLKTNYNKL